MFRLQGTSLVLVLLLALPGVALAQNTGKLAGVVTDATTGEGLPGAQIVVQGTQLGAATDIDGNYVILGIPVGQYDVEARFVGYETETVTDVEVSSGRTRELDFALGEDTQLLEEVVIEYERPIIQRDAIGVPRVVTGEEIRNLPVRGVANVAAIQAGVVSNEGSDNLFVRGGREQEVSYYVDGVKVVGAVGVPEAAVAEEEFLIGTIPPQYGDATSGVISISTRSGGNEFFGSLEAVTSEALDAYGYNLAALSLGGPLIRNRASFFLSAQGTYIEDDSPYSISTLRLNDDVYNQLQASPRVLTIPIETDISTATAQPFVTGDQFYYFSLPESLPDSASTADVAAALGLPESTIAGANLESATRFIADRSLFDEISGKDDPSRNLTLNGNLTVTPIADVNLRIGGAYTTARDQAYSYTRSFFNRDLFSLTDDRTGRIYGTLRQTLSNTAFYQLQVEYTDRFFETYPEQFGDELTDVLSYGDIDHSVNAVAAAYRSFVDTDGDGATDTFVSAFQDGQINPANEYFAFSSPGTPLGGYQKFSQRQLRFSGNATTQLGVHELSFGGEYEQLTQRNYQLFNGFTLSLARYVCDDPDGEDCGAEQPFAAYDYNGDGTLDPGVTTYEQLPFGVGFGSVFNTRYYGYDYLGLNEVDDQELEAYAGVPAENDGIDNDQDGVADEAGELRFNYNVAPYKPIYYGGYVRDRVEFNDLVIDLGLRLDVFDNNTLVLRDPFAQVDIYRVSDFGSGDITDTNGNVVIFRPDEIPGNVSGDFAVYRADNEVIGYRDLEGNFYNTNGEEVDPNEVLDFGQPVQVAGSSGLDAEAFEEYEPQVTVMPRIGVTFPVTDQALFFASYNVTAQRPSENAFETIQGYSSVRSGQGTLNNANLKPEVTTQYELGFRQRLGERAALTLSGFYRTQRNKVSLRNIRGAFPAEYTTYTNQDFTTTKGVEVGFELRRTNNVAINANYTLSFAEGTGSDSGTARIIAWRSPSGFFPETLAPLDFDQRHNLNVSLDYRLGEGEGPMIGGVRPLAGFGFNVLAVVKSGIPYTQLDETADGEPIVNSTNGGAQGPINGVRTPWTSRLDLRVDRAFSLGPASLKGYLWVQNLFDTDQILGVYRTTGEVDDDGYLATEPDDLEVLNTDLEREAFLLQYGEYVGGPVIQNGFRVGGTQLYGLPRRIRLGVILDF